MRIQVLVSILLISVYINAQSLLPRAGEIPARDISKTELARLTRGGRPVANEPMTVLDFDSSNVSFRGNLPFSTSYAIGTNETGNIVFLGSGGGILITDVSNPQSPQVMSEVRTRSLVDDFIYDSVNKRLYICAYFSGIEIWDLADIHNPVRMSRIATEPYPRSGIAFKGNYLFIASNDAVRSIDISDPYHPAYAGELMFGEVLKSDLELKGDVLYFSDQAGIKLVDVSNPNSLQPLTSYSYAALSEFEIDGNYLYAITNAGQLEILNISDSMNVTEESSTTLSGYAKSVTVIGNTAYVAKSGTDGGLQLVDVTNPVSPSIGSLYSGDYQYVSAVQNYVYLSGNSRFSVLNISNPSSIQYVAGLNLPGFVQYVSTSGKYAYAGGNGFRVIDISDTTHPVQVGYADVTGDLSQPVGDSIVIFMPLSMTSNNTIHVMDVSDHANPVSISSYTCPVMTGDFAVKDSLVFVSCWWDGVRVFNIKDPANITPVAHIMGWTQSGVAGTDWCYAQAVAVEGNYLYIADYGPFETDDTFGIYIIDISNPSQPVLVKRFRDFTSHQNDIAVQNGKLYIGDGYGSVQILDVSDPHNPVLMSAIPIPDGATGIYVSGNYAYASAYINGGVQVVDVTNSSNPAIAGWYKPTGCFAVGVTYNNGFIYAADGIAGFQVYRNLLEPVLGVEEHEAVVSNYKLEQNYPNPFNPATTIQFSLPAESKVSLKIYNSLGQETAVLVNGTMPAGNREVRYNASTLSSGVYFYRLEASGIDGAKFTSVKKMIVLK